MNALRNGSDNGTHPRRGKSISHAAGLVVAALVAGAVLAAPRPDLRTYFQSGFSDTKYQKACLDAVLKTWKSPKHWPKPGQKSVVQSVIGKNGRLVNAALTLASGSTEWDRAALDAVKGAAFPPLPKGSTPSAGLQVHWHFSVVP